MEKFWKFIEDFMHFVIFRMLHLKMKDETREKLCQFVKFGVVGLSNTLISYVVYVVLVSCNVHYLLASLVGFIASVINAYYWNNKYVFQSDQEEERVWWKVFFKTVASYAGTGLILNNILLVLWVEIIGLPEMLGPIINLFVTIPLNFLLNKYWAFRKKES